MSVPSLRCKLRGDPYAVLGLDRNADDRKIRAAYYREARRWHPDKQQNPDKLAQSTAKFQQVQHAYEQILCSGRSDSAKPTKQNCKAATPGAWPNSSSGNCHGSARAPQPEPRRPDPEPRPRARSGRGAPLFAEGWTPEERRWQEAEAQMQREAEEVMGRSAEYAEEVLRRRYQQQKASLQELLKQAQERKRREGESINEKLRDWNRKQKDAEGGAQEAPEESVPKGPEPDPSEPKGLAGRGPLGPSQNAEAPEAAENSVPPEPATGGPLPRELLDPTKAARSDPAESQGCFDGPGDVPATPISRRRRGSRRTESQGSRRRRRHKGQEVQKVAAGPLPRPHSVEAFERSSQQGPIDKDEAPAAAMVLEGLRPAVWRWYLLFRLLLLLRDRGRAKAQLGGAVRRLASQWSQLAEGLLRRSRGPLEERARLARRECVLEQWASLCAALQGRARSQEHLRKSAQDRIKASLASPFSELSRHNGADMDR